MPIKQYYKTREELIKENNALRIELSSLRLLHHQMKAMFENFDNRINNIDFSRKLTIQEGNSIVINAVCNHFGVPQENIKSELRNRDTHAIPRQFFFYFMTEIFNFKPTEVARMVSKNHATVLHGKKEIIKFLEFDKEYQYNYQAIKSFLIKQGVKRSTFIF